MWLAKVAVVAGVVAAGVGCAHNTGADWDRPMVLASDVTPSAVEGRWEGSWQSYEFWDSGLFHMDVTPSDVAVTPTTLPGVASLPMPGTKRYLAHVKMWHWGTICPEEFNMIMVSKPGIEGQIEVHGERDLGPLNGFCKYDGLIDRARATTGYVTRGDFGTVVLRRVVSQ